MIMCRNNSDPSLSVADVRVNDLGYRPVVQLALLRLGAQRNEDYTYVYKNM